MTKRKRHNLPMQIIGGAFNLLEDGIVGTLNTLGSSSETKKESFGQYCRRRRKENEPTHNCRCSVKFGFGPNLTPFAWVIFRPSAARGVKSARVHPLAGPRGRPGCLYPLLR